MNTYLYANANPLRFSDPYGLLPTMPWPALPDGPWYGNWCGPGGDGGTKNCIDKACKNHDLCYQKCRLDASTRWNPGNFFSRCAFNCDRQLIKDWADCDDDTCQK